MGGNEVLFIKFWRIFFGGIIFKIISSAKIVNKCTSLLEMTNNKPFFVGLILLFEI